MRKKKKKKVKEREKKIHKKVRKRGFLTIFQFVVIHTGLLKVK